jgi:hypothetical protein
MMNKNLWRRLCLTALFMTSGAAHAVNCSEELLKSLVIEEPQFRFVKDRNRNYGEFIGIIRNTGKEKAANIQIVTRHLDAQQRLIDVQQDYLHGLTLAPGEDLPFRFGFSASLPESAYASHQVQVVDADCAYRAAENVAPPVSAPDEPPAVSWAQWLLSWGRWLWDTLVPVVFIGFFLFLMFNIRRSGPRTSGLLTQQLELTTQQNALLERIAQALEERNKQ